MYSKNEVGAVFQEDFSCDNFHKKAENSAVWVT